MLSSEMICLQIRKLYPDIGACGIDLTVEFDDQLSRWVLYLSRKGKQLKTYLAPDDVEMCIQGRQCIDLGIEINQLKDSIDRMPGW